MWAARVCVAVPSRPSTASAASRSRGVGLLLESPLGPSLIVLPGLAASRPFSFGVAGR